MHINDLWNNEDVSMWFRAIDAYYKSPNVDETFERKMEKISLFIEDIRKMNGEDFYKFLYDDYFRWKFSDCRYLKVNRGELEKYRSIGMDELCNIKDEIFELWDEDQENTKALIKTAIKIKGLYVAGGSGLLSMLFPDHYGTVDQFAVKSLKMIDELSCNTQLKKITPTALGIKNCVFLENIYRNKAKELNHKFRTSYWTPRKIDMVLWVFRDGECAL